MFADDQGAPGLALAEHYEKVRRFTLHLCEPLVVEDYVVQSMADASPTKWHLAHTTWFFEHFVLSKALDGYRPFDAQYNVLFNSYYNSVGPQHARAQRGLLSRPSVEEITRYRDHVDRLMAELLENPQRSEQVNALVSVGLHHEQQHQELLLTDIKHVFYTNPLRPTYRTPKRLTQAPAAGQTGWHACSGGVYRIGHNAQGFAFDNETPRHSTFIAPFELSDRLVTNAEFMEFVEAGGYHDPRFWLSDGWAAVCTGGWQAPMYWENHGSDWWQMTLGGMRPLDRSEPVCHVSFYEAEAYARWAGARLPSEAEWEVVAASLEVRGNFVDDGFYHPVAMQPGAERQPAQLFGDVWEWTASPYTAYPGHRPWTDALGEYNNKFMCNQMVLRGGSCASSASHVRATYRNFFAAHTRWQFTGFRVAR
ncbi:MAG: ergothioneine biosynthesis protein EgtB [Bradymonadaceae bacterium]|nr:ergothioneine biosynthesis protein EgtB [Lujinxingiaceae bacterium]